MRVSFSRLVGTFYEYMILIHDEMHFSKSRWKLFYVTSLLIVTSSAIEDHNHGHHHDSDDFVFNAGQTSEQIYAFKVESAIKQKRYLLYDTNQGEGFNLRRDVYLRLANLIRKLQSARHAVDWTLVLPPWGNLYHWRSIGQQHSNYIAWSHFFDLDSLKKHVDVIEFEDFVKTNAGDDDDDDDDDDEEAFKPEFTKKIDLVYELQYFEDTFQEKDGALVDWVDKFDENVKCLRKRSLYKRDSLNRVRGHFWGYGQTVYAANFSCLSLQGSGSTLMPLLLSTNASSVMLDRSEIILHDGYGDAEYWKARRSMRFSKYLREFADRFRLSHLNSSDPTDNTVLPDDWRLTKPPKGSAIGGPYLAVHLRRQDYLSARPEHVPSLESAGKQIQKYLHRLNLTKVFVATDAPSEEFRALKETLVDVIRFVPTQPELEQLKDGGVAIIDQWICAHARHFVGTYESTFSFRIQEEREILGFDAETTFNRLCGDSEPSCEQPSRWLLVYE